MGEWADAGAEVRIPRSALGSVQRALASVHAAVGLRATLQAIAEGVTSSTPYTEVTLTTAREPDAVDLHVEAVVGPPEAVAMLLGTTCPRAALVEHLAGGEAWGGLRFWSHFGETDGVIMFVPDYEPLDVPDAWRPEYELMAPLYGPGSELIGTMSLDRPRDGRVPPPWANEFLELFAEQAVIAILNARRHEQALRAMRRLERERAALHAAFAEQRARETDLRHQTRRDSLTGLANRVLLRERLEERLAAQIPLSVVFCDLDHFKGINDTHGHAVGDEVLRVTGAAAGAAAGGRGRRRPHRRGRVRGGRGRGQAAGRAGVAAADRGGVRARSGAHRRPEPAPVMLAGTGVRARRCERPARFGG